MLEGVLAGIERGWFQQLIAEAAFEQQRRYESGDLAQVGVNRFVDGEDAPVEILEIGPDVERQQVERVRAHRAARDPEAAASALSRLTELSAGDANLIEPLVACARAGCTEGEIVATLTSVFGDYRETPRF